MKKKIDYASFYGGFGMDSHELALPRDPSIVVFFNERKKLFLRYFKKLERRGEEMRVLDVGCYTGKTLFDLFRHETKKHEYWGIDLNKEGIAFCKEYASSNLLPKFHFEALDISKKNWNKKINQKFDLIIFSEVIEHLYFKDQRIALEELNNLLADDGILIITCPNKSCLIKKILKLGENIPLLKNYIKTLGKFEGSEGHVGEFSFSELRKKVQNFKIIKHSGLTFTYGHEKIGNSTFLMICLLILNKIFHLFLPFWAFDQYVILKKKRD